MESEKNAQLALLDELKRTESELTDELNRTESRLHKLLAEKEKDFHGLVLNVFHMFFPFHSTQLIQLAELRRAFNLMKKLPICGGCKEHLDFELSVIHYLQEVGPTTTNAEICMWIESEYAKLAPRGVLHNFAFIRSLFAAIIHCSVWSTPLHTEVFAINKEDFRLWAPILHCFTSDHNVAASQILLFVVQDYASPLKYPKCVLSEILEVLSENEKFLSFIDKDGANYSKERSVFIVMNGLLLNAEKFPETCA